MCDPWLVAIDLLAGVLDVSHASLVVAALSLVITAIVTLTCCIKDQLPP